MMHQSMGGYPTLIQDITGLEFGGRGRTIASPSSIPLMVLRI